jgi:hypothetical protein
MISIGNRLVQYTQPPAIHTLHTQQWPIVGAPTKFHPVKLLAIHITLTLQLPYLGAPTLWPSDKIYPSLAIHITRTHQWAKSMAKSQCSFKMLTCKKLYYLFLRIKPLFISLSFNSKSVLINASEIFQDFKYY